MKIKIKKLNKDAIIPKYQTKHSVGMDLHARIDKPITLKPGERAVIWSGISVALPSGYEAQIRPRSGLAAKHGISIVNSPGTIDADYRGEIGAILINLGKEDFEIKSGDRIAQMVIAKYEQADFVQVKELDITERGDGRLGSTGK
ncbi:MAG: dUTP diphosphatase [Candidatus Saccharibacteria bacterium]